MDLYHDEKGKLKGEIIRKIHWNNPDYVPQYKKEGYQLFERLYQGDILEIEGKERDHLVEKTSKLEKTQSIRIGNALPNTTFVSIYTFTEVGSGICVYFDSPSKSYMSQQGGSAYISQFPSLNLRKVQLTNTGLIKYRSKLLK